MITFGSDPIFVLAQVNIGGNPAVILGIALALCGVALYGMRSVRPELSRDHDIFFAAVALISGLILMFQGWRLDPLLLLGQLSLAGSAVFFAVENIRLRGVTTEQAKRNTPIVDDERPVSRSYSYEAELDELPSMEERMATRRIRGSRDPRASESDGYAEEVRRRPTSRRSQDEDDYGMSASDRLRKRRLSRSQSRPIDRPERRSVWDDNDDDVRDDVSSGRSDVSYRSPSRPPSTRPSRPPSRRRRPPGSASQRGASSNMPDDYVDYRPVNYAPDDESEGPLGYDERYS
jgi:hypothetical protein